LQEAAGSWLTCRDQCLVEIRYAGPVSQALRLTTRKLAERQATSGNRLVEEQVFLTDGNLFLSSCGALSSVDSTVHYKPWEVSHILKNDIGWEGKGLVLLLGYVLALIS
jgi:hypothetical protein